MARRRNATARRALTRAFAAGALTGAAGTLTLRRRRPKVNARFDARSQGSDSMPVAKHG